MKPHPTAQGIFRWHSGHKHACTPPRLHGARLCQCRQRTTHGMPVHPEPRCQLSLGWQFVVLALTASGYFAGQRGGNRSPDRGARSGTENARALRRPRRHRFVWFFRQPDSFPNSPNQMTARPDTAASKAWMGLLARARPDRLAAVVPDLPGHDLLHAPEIGAVMV